MFRLFFIFCLCFHGFACQESRASKAEEDQFAIKKDPPPQKQNLESICLSVNGTFNPRNQSCECSHEQQVLMPLYSQNGRGSEVLAFACRAIPYFQPTAQSQWQSFQDILNNEGKEALIRELQQVRHADNRRVLQLHVHPDIRLAKLRRLTKRLDDDPLPLRIPNGYRRGDRFDIYFDFPEVAIAHLRLAQQMPLHNYEDEDHNAVGRFLYAWHDDELYELMNGESKSLSYADENPYIHTASAALQELRRYWSGVSHQLRDIKEERLDIAEACHEICRQTWSFSFADRSYWLERHIIRTHVVHQFLYTGNADRSQKDAVFVLGDQLQISFSLSHDYQYLDHEDNLRVKTKVFDTNGHLMQELSEKAFINPIRAMNNLYHLPPYPSQMIQALIVFGQFSLEDPAQARRLLKGPFASHSPREGGSLLGWVSTQVDTSLSGMSRFFDAVYQPWSTMDSSHTDLVLDELYQDSAEEAYVIPVGYPSLLDGTYRQILKTSHAKLVLLSATIPMQKSGCQQWFGELEQSALWIMAAGNDGVEDPKFRCPQGLGSSQNRLVVASTNGHRLDSRSDYGIQYADIAAPGIASNGYRGSSFAAPKVARLAAHLLHLYPDMAVADLRLSILLGSKFKPGHVLPVRSGGSLRADWALLAAEAINELPYTERQILRGERAGGKLPIYEKIIRSFSDLSEDDIKLQIEYLLQNGV